jgi:hypothetical protein
MKSILTFILLLAGTCSFAQSQNPLQRLHYLLGDWVAEGSSVAGSGYYSFKEDLDQHILVRRNHADVPATAEHKPISHDDMMVVYADKYEKAVKALFTDNEGHVIQYKVNASEDGKTVTFLSAANGSFPLFKLTYAFADENNVVINFQVAQASAPDDFHTYISGKAHRK